jgi:hypothetical protein
MPRIGTGNYMLPWPETKECIRDIFNDMKISITIYHSTPQKACAAYEQRKLHFDSLSKSQTNISSTSYSPVKEDFPLLSLITINLRLQYRPQTSRSQSRRSPVTITTQASKEAQSGTTKNDTNASSISSWTLKTKPATPMLLQDEKTSHRPNPIIRTLL